LISNWYKKKQEQKHIEKQILEKQRQTNSDKRQGYSKGSKQGGTVQMKKMQILPAAPDRASEQDANGNPKQDTAVEDDYRKFREKCDNIDVKGQQKEENEGERNPKQRSSLPQIAGTKQEYRINDYAELDVITSDWTLPEEKGGRERARQLLREAEQELEEEEAERARQQRASQRMRHSSASSRSIASSRATSRGRPSEAGSRPGIGALGDSSDDEYGSGSGSGAPGATSLAANLLLMEKTNQQPDGGSSSGSNEEADSE